MVCIPLEQLFNLQEVMLLGKFDRLVPLIEQDTTINSFLDISHFEI